MILNQLISLMHGILNSVTRRSGELPEEAESFVAVLRSSALLRSSV